MTNRVGFESELLISKKISCEATSAQTEMKRSRDQINAIMDTPNANQKRLPYAHGPVSFFTFRMNRERSKNSQRMVKELNKTRDLKVKYFTNFSRACMKKQQGQSKALCRRNATQHCHMVVLPLRSLCSHYYFPCDIFRFSCFA